ncbi:lipopolysaccharide biosynthesis protein [Odoribacter lunatus]|uniref:lipopolysaccharide biosynthesis protein n=1 Tax=Odoribacter lunatus TaxID=2941335 RepID=UPI0020401C58|nr:polysaccharide biosynthesis protein [Odoribacter lunatus]
MGVIIRQSIKATVFNYIGAFIGFLTTFFILTKYVEPEVIGLTKVMYEVAALVAGFAQLGTSASAMRFFPYFRNPENNHNGFFFYLMLMPAIGSAVFIGLFFLLKGLIIDFFAKKSPLFVEYSSWVVPLTLFLLFWTVLEVYSNLLMRIVVPKFIREVGVRVMLLVVYMFYAFRLLDLAGLVTGCVCVYGMAMLCTFVYVSHIGTISMKHNFAFIDRDLRKKILYYTLFLIVGAFGGSIMAQLDLFMVSSKMGLDYAGVYTVAFYMAAVIEMPARSILAISSPLAAAALKEGDFVKANELYKKVSLHQLIAGSSLFLMIWINIDNIFDIIPNGDVYETGKWVVFFIGLSKLVAITLNFGGTLISFSRYYYWGLYFTFFLTALTIYTNYLLIPRFGITGAAVASFITCLISYLWQQWIVLKKVKGNPYDVAMLKQIGMVVLLFGVNHILPVWKISPILDGCYRSLVIGAFWSVLIHRLRVSEELNRLIGKIRNRVWRIFDAPSDPID